MVDASTLHGEEGSRLRPGLRPRAGAFALAAIALVPLARGGFATGALVVAALLCTFAAKGAIGGVPVRALRLFATLGCGAIAWMLAALVPLPAAWRHALAPGAFLLDRTLGRADDFAPLSQDPAATRAVLLALLLGAAVFATAAAIANDPQSRRLLLAAVVLAASVVALVGVAETLLGHPLIQRDLPPHARPFGPFANRNHAATLVLLALPLAIGFAGSSPRERTLARFSRVKGHLALAASALLVLALLLNGSRGGSLAAVGALAFTVLVARVRPLFKYAVALLIAGALVVPGTAWARRGDEVTLHERLGLVRDALRMARDAPLTGIGPGAFAAAYPPYQSVAKDLRFRHVESEPLELLVEGGIPLLLLGMAAALLVTLVAARTLRSATSVLDAGVAVSVVALLLHACWDFPLRVPGVALPFLLVLGTLFALQRSPA